MRRVGITAAVMVLCLGMKVFAAGEKEKRPAAGDAPLRVVLYLNGNLGDQSFADSAYRGLQRAIDEFGILGVRSRAAGIPRTGSRILLRSRRVTGIL